MKGGGQTPGFMEDADPAGSPAADLNATADAAMTVEPGPAIADEWPMDDDSRAEIAQAYGLERMDTIAAQHGKAAALRYVRLMSEPMRHSDPDRPARERLIEVMDARLAKFLAEG